LVLVLLEREREAADRFGRVREGEIVAEGFRLEVKGPIDIDEHYVAEMHDRALVLEQDPGRCQSLPHMITAEWNSNGDFAGPGMCCSMLTEYMYSSFSNGNGKRRIASGSNSPEAIRRFPFPFEKDEYMYSVNIEQHMPGPAIP
jgi:hypothetical protein